MPKAHGAGYSDDYPAKQQQLRELTGAILGIASNVVREKAWAWQGLVVWDLHAGSGAIEGIPGSPLVLMDVLTHLPRALPVQAYFFEKQAGACRELTTRLEAAGYPAGSWRVLRGDTRETVPALLAEPGALPPRKCFGLVYADPNAMLIPGPLQALATHPRLGLVDFLLRPGVGQYHRVGGLPNGGQGLAVPQRSTTLDTELLALGKTHYALSTPTQTAWHHTWILATNGRLLIDRLHKQLAPRGTPEGEARWENTLYSRRALGQRRQLDLGLEAEPPAGENRWSA